MLTRQLTLIECCNYEDGGDVILRQLTEINRSFDNDKGIYYFKISLTNKTANKTSVQMFCFESIF